MSLPDTPPTIELPHVAAEFKAAEGTPKISFTVTRPRCEAAEEDEIVVCGSDPDRYRLRPLANNAFEDPAKAQLQIGEGVAAILRAESSMISGVPSNRAMVDLKIKF